MRIKIPHPLQTWLSNLSGLLKKQVPTGKTTREISEQVPSQHNAIILSGIQSLLHELISVRPCSEAVTVARTICSHIYEFAKISDTSLQSLALELIPTLIHVYLLNLAGRPGVGKYRRKQRSSKQFQNSQVFSQKSGESDKSELKSNSRLTTNRGTILAASNYLRPARLNRSVRCRTRRIITDLNPGKSRDQSNHTPEKPTKEESKEGHKEQIRQSLLDENISALSIVFEVCLLGLHNLYISKQMQDATFTTSSTEFSSSDALVFTIPSLSDGSVFSSPANHRGRGKLHSVPDTTLVSTDAASTSNQLSIACAPVDLGRKGSVNSTNFSAFNMGQFNRNDFRVLQPHFTRKLQVTASNRTSILRYLCRVFTDNLCEVSSHGRRAICNLALLHGPSGLCNGAHLNSCTQSVATRRKRWRRFTGARLRRHGTVDVSTLAAEALRVSQTGKTTSQELTPTVSEMHLEMDPTSQLLTVLENDASCASQSSRDSDSNTALDSQSSSESNSSQSPRYFDRVNLNSNQTMDENYQPRGLMPDPDDSLSPRQPGLPNASAVDTVDGVSVPSEEEANRPANSLHSSPPVATPGVKEGASKAATLPFRSRLSHPKRLPQASAQLILEVLPALHFLLDKEEAPLAAKAVTALEDRANLELWSDVLLYINAIKGQELFRKATSKTNYDDISQSKPSIIDSFLSWPTSEISGISKLSKYRWHPFFLSASFMEDEESQMKGPVSDHQLPSPITNATFQTSKPPDDIPLVASRLNSPRSTISIGKLTSLHPHSAHSFEKLPKLEEENSQASLPTCLSAAPTETKICASQTLYSAQSGMGTSRLDSKEIIQADLQVKLSLSSQALNIPNHSVKSNLSLNVERRSSL